MTIFMSTDVRIFRNNNQQGLKVQKSNIFLTFPHLIANCIQFYPHCPVDKTKTKKSVFPTLNRFFAPVNHFLSTGLIRFIVNGKDWI